MHVQFYKGIELVSYQEQMDHIDMKPQAKATTNRLEELKMNLIGSGTKYREDNFSLDCFNETAPAYMVDTKNYTINSLDTLSCLPCVAQCPTPKARDDNMYVSQDVTVTEKNDASQTRSYFLTRVEGIFYEKEVAAMKTYGFVGEDRYLSPNELVERIKAGAFTIDSDEADEPSYAPLECFTWNPVKKDRKGLAAYRTALNDLTVQTKDAIWAETDFSKLPGLVAAFKAATITPVTLN